jgi:hypothetical protein
MIFSKTIISRCKQTDIRSTVLSPMKLTPAIASVVVTGDNLSQVSLLPAIN